MGRRQAASNKLIKYWKKNKLALNLPDITKLKSAAVATNVDHLVPLWRRDDACRTIIAS